MFSKACMYAIRAMALMATSGRNDPRWTLGRIAKETGAPEAFMGKILQQLVHAGLLRSVKGPGGGFDIAPERVKDLKLGEVVSVIDGSALFEGCALGFPKCDNKRPCPIHHQVVKVREDLRNVLGAARIKELGSALEGGEAHLRSKL